MLNGRLLYQKVLPALILSTQKKEHLFAAQIYHICYSTPDPGQSFLGDVQELLPKASLVFHASQSLFSAWGERQTHP